MSTQQTVAARIASLLQAIENCNKSGNWEWRDRHTESLRAIQKQLPSGSGIDSGTTIDMDRSTPERIVLVADFHHMNDAGMYDGWTAHTVIVRASLLFGLDIRISGRDRNGIKEYLGDVYREALGAMVQS